MEKGPVAVVVLAGEVILVFVHCEMRDANMLMTRTCDSRSALYVFVLSLYVGVVVAAAYKPLYVNFNTRFKVEKRVNEFLMWLWRPRKAGWRDSSGGARVWQSLAKAWLSYLGPAKTAGRGPPQG